MPRRTVPVAERIPVCALCGAQYHAGYWNEHAQSSEHQAAVGREVARLRARIKQRAGRGR